MLKSNLKVDDKFVKLSKEAEVFTSKLIQLVGDPLKFSKLHQGELPLNRCEIKLSDIIDGCCTHIQLVGSFYITYVGNHALELYVDMLKIDQVIVNSISKQLSMHQKQMRSSCKWKKLAIWFRFRVRIKEMGFHPRTYPICLNVTTK